MNITSEKKVKIGQFSTIRFCALSDPSNGEQHKQAKIITNKTAREQNIICPIFVLYPRIRTTIRIRAKRIKKNVPIPIDPTTVILNYKIKK